MPQLACNPILINITGLTSNAFVDANLNVTAVGRVLPNVNIPVKLRTDASGKVSDFDISPLVAGVCRQYFDAEREKYKTATYDNGMNQWKYALLVGTDTKASGNVLFGAGAVEEADIQHPYLLRRNTSTIHYYQGLPGGISQLSPAAIMVMTDNLIAVRKLTGSSSSLFVTYNFYRLGFATGKYYLVGASSVKDTVWKDARIWTDAEVWRDTYIEDLANAVVYPLHVHSSPADCLRGGAKIYVRYWNSRGTWSYALLDVLYNDLKAKTEYADSWRLDANPVNGRILGDRVQTDKEITYSMTAGRDGLDRLDVDELRDMQRSYCVQVWDIDQEAWRDCYVQDATTRNAGGRGQEMTFTLEMPHEYTFTR